MDNIFVAEMVGTAILILLGDGVVAGVVLARSKARDAGWIVITAGWAIAVAVAVYAVGRYSGAHLNPAVTLGLVASGADISAGEVAQYVLGQFAGAAIGAVLVFVHYLPHWGATDDPAVKLGAFCNSPAIRNAPANVVAEVIGTFVLVFGVLAIGDHFSNAPVSPDLREAFATGLGPLLVGLLILGIGLSLGGPTGYAINPARDLAPRIVHALLPIPGKGGSDWGYSWVPVVGPAMGGLAGGWVFSLLF